MRREDAFSRPARWNCHISIDMSTVADLFLIWLCIKGFFSVEEESLLAEPEST
jgi:hypothetical protein